MIKKNHHILFVSAWWPTAKKSNGTFVELHALGLVSRGCKCTVLLTSESSAGKHLKEGLIDRTMSEFRRHPELSFIDNSVVHKWPLRLAKDPETRRKSSIVNQTLSRISDYIQAKGKPDFIFHHGVFNYTYLSEAISRKFDIPIWYMENSPKISPDHIPTANPFASQKDLVRFAQNANRRFAVTNDYVRKMKEVFKVPFELCPNIITDDFFIQAKEHSKPKGYFQFVNVAILDERKNQQLLLKSFAENYKDKDRFRLAIAGDGDLYEDLKRLATDLGIEKQVKITGFLDRKQLKELLDQSHCFVLTSKSETFGVVVIEAMARGIPAISSNIDGTREIINEENGILFQEGNQNSLSEAMNNLVNNYAKYNPGKIVSSVKQSYGPDGSYKALFKQ